MTLEKQKKEWRKRLDAKRRGLVPETVELASAAIAERLCGIERLGNADVLAGYWPLEGEVDLREFLKGMLVEGKTVCLPRRRPGRGAFDYELAAPRSGTFDDTLSEGGFGVMEPVGGNVVDERDVDVWIVPGVGFDRSGNRLGRGGGVYDMLLEGSPGLKVGVGFECQLASAVPAGDGDRKMDVVVTDKETIWIGQ